MGLVIGFAVFVVWLIIVTDGGGNGEVFTIDSHDGIVGYCCKGLSAPPHKIIQGADGKLVVVFRCSCGKEVDASKIRHRVGVTRYAGLKAGCVSTAVHEVVEAMVDTNWDGSRYRTSWHMDVEQALCAANGGGK